MRAGFIGLGMLGRAMAQRLIDQGVGLTVWNRTASKAQGLDAEVVKSPAAVMKAEDVIFLNLFDSAAVESVLEAMLSVPNPAGKLIIDTTTNHYSNAEAFHRILASHNVKYIEAPVLGSTVPASRGALTVLAGGPAESYEKALPYLRNIGSSIFHFERPGLATRMKLINNMLLGVFMSGIAEALAMAEAAGLSKTEALDVLGAGAGKSLVLDAKRQKLIDGDFSTHFSVELIYKDLHFLQDLARDMSRPAFTAATPKELFALAVSRGMAKEDFSAVYKLFADQTGK